MFFEAYRFKALAGFECTLDYASLSQVAHFRAHYRAALAWFVVLEPYYLVWFSVYKYREPVLKIRCVDHDVSTFRPFLFIRIVSSILMPNLPAK